MADDVHRSALRATAKIALSLTVIGCGGRVEVHETPDTPEGTGGAPGTTSSTTTITVGPGGAPGTGGTTALGGAGGTEAIFCDAASPAAPVELDPASFACCVDHLTSQPTESWTSPTEELVACCYEVVGQIDQEPALASQIDESLVAPVWPADDQIGCCEVLGNPCTMPCGCTVWGPPMPFRLAGRLRLLDEVA